MESIASGAEEAASSAEQARRAVTEINSGLLVAKDAADVSRRKTDALRTLIVDVTHQIGGSVAQVAAGADRQASSVKMIVELER